MKASLTRRHFLKSAGVTVSAGLLAGGKMADAINPDPQEGEPVRVPLRIILVRTSQEASEIIAQLNAGVPFEKLAQEHSIDPSATNGGYLGHVRISRLQPEVREAIIHLYPGEASDVIEIPSGYVIVEVLPEAAALEIESSEYEWKLAEAQHAKAQVVPLVDGFYVALDFFTREPKRPNWNQDLPTICQMHRHALTQGTQTIEAHLEESKSRSDLAGMARDYEALAQIECYQTKMGKAIKDFQSEYQIAVSNNRWDAQHKLEEKLGIAYMFQGDIENLAKTVHIESSLFPIRPEAKFKLASSEETAVKHFLTFLQREPSGLEVKWLLNIACMKLGKYPEAVPPKHLIPPGAFKSDENIGRFVDLAPSLGLNIVGLAGSLIVDDFDNDGFLDVVMSDYGPCTPMRYFHNNGDGTFTDRSAESGLSKQLGGFNMIQADYNNDGWLDILVLRGAWELPMRKSLLRNNGDGTFTDVTQESGLAIPATMTQTAAWADFDNDGHIDLFGGNENSPSQLFHNRGDGTFVDVALPAGVGRIRASKSVVAGDYDNDGFPDFYVSNLDGENYLYHNNGDGTFTDVAKELHVELPLLSFPAWFFDYNNDGWLDLFVTSDYHSVVEVAAGYLNLPLKGEGCKLYKNSGQGAFQDVSKQVGLDRSFMPMGANFGDIDNDGFLDLYLGTGAPSYGALVPNVLFRNHDGKYFVEITASSGTGSLEKGHGVAFADINNDGQEELFSRMGGMTSGDKATTLVFRTPRNENNWITVHLVGVKTNRAAIGARIKVTVETAGHNTRSIHRVVGSGGSFGASPLRQHIGLGRAERIEAIEIWWPTSKTRQTFRDVPMNQFIEIKEFAKSFTVQRRRSFPFRGRRG
jgi:ASPIC and UnbV/FG-GAP-like repeat/PPIC-type PPIASE domain